MAAVLHIAVGLALGKRRRGEQRGRERLQRERNAEFLHHVGPARIVEVGLDRAGSQHNVEAEAADARHMIEHDLVATLGHDRQLGARIVGPNSDAAETVSEFGADFLPQLEWAERVAGTASARTCSSRWST